MVYWLGRYSYFNHEQIQISSVEMMNAAFKASGLFGSRDRSNFIGHKNYTGRRRNFCSKLTIIHGAVHKSEFNFYTV